jgi:hypothetical protein
VLRSKTHLFQVSYLLPPPPPSAHNDVRVATLGVAGVYISGGGYYFCYLGGSTVKNHHI